jgi:hypothetical protein
LITPTSTIGIQGTTTNDAPQAGCVGEVFDFLGTAVSLTTATPKTVLTEVLQAGDYEISCSVYFTVSSAASLLAAGVSFTTNTFLAAPYLNSITAASGSPFSSSALPSGPSTLRCAGPTSVFVIAQANFSAGTVTGTPQLHVRRAR